ncbi:hypothetical protein JZU46_03995 [bacterium]|nr:hypothetical protein [bacterium]
MKVSVRWCVCCIFLYVLTVSATVVASPLAINCMDGGMGEGKGCVYAREGKPGMNIMIRWGGGIFFALLTVSASVLASPIVVDSISMKVSSKGKDCMPYCGVVHGACTEWDHSVTSLIPNLLNSNNFKISTQQSVIGTISDIDLNIDMITALPLKLTFNGKAQGGTHSDDLEPGINPFGIADSSFCMKFTLNKSVNFRVEVSVIQGFWDRPAESDIYLKNISSMVDILSFTSVDFGNDSSVRTVNGLLEAGKYSLKINLHDTASATIVSYAQTWFLLNLT